MLAEFLMGMMPMPHEGPQWIPPKPPAVTLTDDARASQLLGADVNLSPNLLGPKKEPPTSDPPANA